MRTGLACCAAFVPMAWLCAPAWSKPPLEIAHRAERVEPLAYAPAGRTADGRIVLGNWTPYSGDAIARGGLGSVVAFDCFGRNFGPFALGPGDDRGDGQPFGPGVGYFDEATQAAVYCGDSCIDRGSRWFFGSAYHNPNTVEDMQGIEAPPGAVIEEIDVGFFWKPPAPEHCYLVYFFFEDVLQFDPSTHQCSDPATFTLTSGGVGIVVDMGVLAPSTRGYYFWTAVKGLALVGATFPLNDANGDGRPDGSYQMIIAKDIDAATGEVTFATGPTQPMLHSTGTGDSAYTPWRPGFNNSDSYDDVAPTNGVFANPAECYSYDGSFGGCGSPLGKMNAFSHLTCAADLNGDGFVDGIDADLFENAFGGSNWDLPGADLNGDCFTDGRDYDAFYNRWLAGC